ncbi:uncharacterized protein MELLADRAFT_63067 [Melampsora larici-populina 98AG31]|uniref:Tet-like 2OG-Fe(II) oxygenase domain-containing protein n=1 Tax=Melampsora larici-populina (strain 98AG31 / pathotype 3-4-7) TaxID=747676 RepID=F4RL63_MELLP|nr:uncharacterized protein MELLADRAFT_63067 [Melampsora larici-populina 98AG31]EGG06921.1 hypothetical protein MELLADRAFT_63067 [Melampsora larici-populina 98AG31]
MTKRRNRKNKAREEWKRLHPTETPRVKTLSLGEVEQKRRSRHNRAVGHTNLVLNPSRLERPIHYHQVHVDDNPNEENYTNGPLPGQEPMIIKANKLWVLTNKRNYKVVALIRQTPFDSMSSKERFKLRFLANYLHEEREFSNPITGNGTMLIIHEKLLVVVVLVREYNVVASCSPTGGDDVYSVVLKYKTSIHNASSPCPNFYIKKPVIKLIPTQTKALLVGPWAFSYRYDVQGGGFWWPDFKCEVDFESCDGITEVLWRGNKDLVCTRPSIEPSGNFTRVGNTFQVNTKYRNACGSITKRWKSYVSPGLTVAQLKQKKLKRLRYIGSPSFLYKMYLKRIEEQEKQNSNKNFESPYLSSQVLSEACVDLISFIINENSVTE